MEREEKLKRFLEELRNDNYEEALKWFGELDLDSEYSSDNNYYLHLLGQFTNIGDTYRIRLCRLKFEDICSDDLNDIEIRARFLNFKHKFAQASAIYEMLDDSSLEMQVVSELLKRSSFELIKLNSMSLNFIRKARYDDLISLYNNISKNRPLSHFERVVLLITNDLKKVTEEGKMPGIMIGPFRDADDLVLLKDYENAFKIITKHGDKNLIYVLLKSISKEIADRSVDFDKVVDSVCSDTVNNIRHNVSCYLKNMGCHKYVRFFNDLITIGICDNDSNYSLALSELSLIKNKSEDVLFDVSNYFDSFYEAISEGNIVKAKIYLDIVSQSRVLCNRYIDVYPMKRELSRAMNAFKKDVFGDKYALLTSVVEDIEESKGLRVLEELSEEEAKNVIRVVSKFPKIMIDNVDGRIVLRYHDVFSICPEFYTLKLQGQEAFINGDYDETIRCYNMVCNKLMNPSVDVYQKLGMAYLRRGSSDDDYRRAIDYLFVARGKGRLLDDKINMLKKRIDYTGEKVKQYTKK